MFIEPLGQWQRILWEQQLRDRYGIAQAIAEDWDDTADNTENYDGYADVDVE